MEETICIIAEQKLAEKYHHIHRSLTRSARIVKTNPKLIMNLKSVTILVTETLKKHSTN